MRRTYCFLAALFLALSMSVANATHFRFGHLTWKPTTGNSIEFELQNAWRRSAYTTANGRCIDPATLGSIPCTGGDGAADIGDIIVEHQGATTFDPGDGSGLVSSPLGSLMYLVKSIDMVNDWIIGLALDPSSFPAVDTTIEHTYAAPGTYTANTASCCRLSPLSSGNAHINNPDGNYRVETLVDVGSLNSSPASALKPIKLCPINAICTIVVPGADAEGNPLSFRMSTPTEASGSASGFRQPGDPGSGAPIPASIDTVTGVYTWDTNGATISAGNTTLYSSQVTLEDATSKSAIDFLITLQAEEDPPFPDFDQSPVCSTTQVLTVGATKTFDVTASDGDAGDTLELNVSGLPATATMTPTLPIFGNPVTSSFSWTPGAGDVGVTVVNFSATSDGGGSGTSETDCPVTLEVLDTLIVGIDIKPFSDPNGLNPAHKGVVPVAILTSDTFNATTVDASTVAFGVDGAAPVHIGGGHVEDADADGDLDLVLHFNTQETGIACGDLSATLTGETFDGQKFEGSDAVKTAGCK